MGIPALQQRIQEFTHYAEVRHLAYNIAALQREKRFHSLTLLSFFPEEGKTLSCAALAIAYAEACDTQVLVVDTTTHQNPRSLTLKDCLSGATPNVTLRSIKELRNRSFAALSVPTPVATIVESTVVTTEAKRLTLMRETDTTLIKQAAQDRSAPYGLVILDTTPLQARNKGNVDPLLVARQSEATVLVISRKFLDSPKLNASLKLLRDPSLHLIGIIGNEEKSK